MQSKAETHTLAPQDDDEGYEIELAVVELFSSPTVLLLSAYLAGRVEERYVAESRYRLLRRIRFLRERNIHF